MCGPSLIVRLTIAVFVFLILCVTSVIHAQRPDSTAGTSNAGTRKLFVDPSSASVALLGKASLIVGPFTHRDGNYVGDYQLKVRPYFFKSEKGSLLLAASDDAVRKLQTGTAINFAGKAVTHKDGRSHIVLGRATPSSDKRGSVTFSIITDDAKNSLQHFLSLRDIAVQIHFPCNRLRLSSSCGRSLWNDSKHHEFGMRIRPPVRLSLRFEKSVDHDGLELACSAPT